MQDTSTSQHQSDSDALVSALGAIGATADVDDTNHPFSSSDFTKADEDGEDGEIDVTGLDMGDDGVDVMQGDDDDLDLSGFDAGGDLSDTPQRAGYGRPPSIRKACDLCHAAKQKCSGDRPSCTRCIAGGWNCVYAPRQRRRTVQREKQVRAATADPTQSTNLSVLAPTPTGQTTKKRKVAPRDSIGTFNTSEIDMKLAMNMAVDLGLANEDEGDEMMTMTDEQMLESIAIDGYLADLPLATFVHNLPFTAPQPTETQPVHFDAADFHTADMDQHTTSALRDAIFSLNESSQAHAQAESGGDDGQGGDGHEGGEGMDPHLALLDLSHAMPGDGEGEGNEGGLNLGSFGSQGAGCNHAQMIPHILALLTQHGLEPKIGSNTPLTMGIFAPLAKSLRLFHSLVTCQSCLSSPQQTLPQLALLSRTATILTFPFPPINSNSVGSMAQLMVHGARLAGTGLSEAIEQHIVGVVWDSWRASIREVFALLERKAQDVITTSAGLGGGDEDEVEDEGADKKSSKPAAKPQNGPTTTSAETQRAGLMFQAMSRLVTAMDEVEGE